MTAVDVGVAVGPFVVLYGVWYLWEKVVWRPWEREMERVETTHVAERPHALNLDKELRNYAMHTMAPVLLSKQERPWTRVELRNWLSVLAFHALTEQTAQAPWPWASYDALVKSDEAATVRLARLEQQVAQVNAELQALQKAIVDSRLHSPGGEKRPLLFSPRADQVLSSALH